MKSTTWAKMMIKIFLTTLLRCLLKKMKMNTILAAVFVILSGGNTVFSSESLVPKTLKPIKIVLNDWTSQIVLSKITGYIFERMGYTVEYSTLSVDEQWGAMTRGLVHVQVEVWEGTMSKMFNRMVDEGGIVDAGSYSAKTREEWWYPAYVEDRCPGLPNWEALKECVEMFVVPETDPRGRYLAGPWEKPDEARIRALDLNFKVMTVVNGDQLWSELREAVKTKRPIVLFNWTPNWVEAVYDGKFIEFPDYEAECETEPQWGINQDLIHDCGNPKNGWLKKAAWSGMEKTWPKAFQTLKNMDLANLIFAELAALVDVDKMSYDEAAMQWLSENEKLWGVWISQDGSKLQDNE